MYFPVELASLILSTTHQYLENGYLIRGPAQLICGPIQRRFGPSWICRLYFLRKSTEFCDMRTYFQRTNNSYPFPTVLLIYNKSPVIAWSLVPRSLKNWSLVFWSFAVKLLPYIRGWKLEPSLKDRIACSRSLYREWTFRNISNWRSIRLTLHPQPTKRSASSSESREKSLSTYQLTK